MKIKLLKLYSSPEVFKPINFDDGVNIIMGERVEEENIKKGKKTNGVGKSLCVEFINFCLLKATAQSRVMKIPIDKLFGNTQIILDLEVNSQKITIIRTKEEPENPIIIKNGEENEFSNLDDANAYLKNLLFLDDLNNLPLSFREFLGPFVREEGSEFKNIIECYDLEKKIPLSILIKPHAFIFNLSISTIDKIENIFKEIDKLNKHKLILKNLLTENNVKKINDIKSSLNSLNDDLEKIETGLENNFKSNEAYESQQESLAKIQTQIDDVRSYQAALKYQLKKIELLPPVENIRKKDIEIIYNQFKSGLGELVSKSIEQAIIFKKKIDEFQNKLFNEKIKSIKDELLSVNSNLRRLEEEKSSQIDIIDKKGVLKDIKNSISIYEQKKDIYQKLKVNYENYEKNLRDIKELKSEKDKYFIEIDKELFNAKKIIDSFNKTILEIHEYIMESNFASFNIETVNSSKSKKVINFEMRIDDDGSHSVDRAKVFIYDISLLFNIFTKERHPKFLIHDNIFDVDQDTLIRSLNYLYLAENKNYEFQYILTLNRDKIENEIAKGLINLNIETHRVANFTKKDRFLYGDKYQEI